MTTLAAAALLTFKFVNDAMFMVVTNAISGMTAVGGMVLLAQGTTKSTGIIPDLPTHWMGAIAVLLFVSALWL